MVRNEKGSLHAPVQLPRVISVVAGRMGAHCFSVDHRNLSRAEPGPNALLGWEFIRCAADIPEKLCHDMLLPQQRDATLGWLPSPQGCHHPDWKQ